MLLASDFRGNFNRVRRIHGDVYVTFSRHASVLELDYVLTFAPERGITVVNEFELRSRGGWFEVLRTAHSFNRHLERISTHQLPSTLVCGSGYGARRLMDNQVSRLGCLENPYVAVIGHQSYDLHGENPLKIGRMVEGCSLLGVHNMRLSKDELVLLVPAMNLPVHGNKVRYFASPLDSCWSDGTQRAWNDSILVDAEDVEFLELGLPLR